MPFSTFTRSKRFGNIAGKDHTLLASVIPVFYPALLHPGPSGQSLLKK
jgi:hypothetical protein